MLIFSLIIDNFIDFAQSNIKNILFVCDINFIAFFYFYEISEINIKHAESSHKLRGI